MQDLNRVGRRLSILGMLLLLPAAVKGQARPSQHRDFTVPPITRPVLFDTPEADAILATLQVFPADNPWNQVVTDWPVHSNSTQIIASIGNDKPLRYNPDMGFILVPPDQKRVEVKVVGYPGESDNGPSRSLLTRGSASCTKNFDASKVRTSRSSRRHNRTWGGYFSERIHAVASESAYSFQR